MIEHYIELGPARTEMLTDALVLQINGIGALARRRRLTDDEMAELMQLTSDWEAAQIAHLSFIEAESMMTLLRLRGLSA